MLTLRLVLLSISLLLCLHLSHSVAIPLAGPSEEALVVAVENSTAAASGGATAADVDLCRQGPMLNVPLIECEAYIPMYTFNFQSGECEGYIYGGCGGSKNLFLSREECEKGCGHHSKRASRSAAPALPATSKSACGQPVEKGRCLAAFNRFAYDHGKGACYEFTYGGCGGNANNFRTEAECLQICAPDLLQVRNVALDERASDAKIVVEAN